ncbi:MAG: 16S rRNA (uracil(1498)-N(3))-methyltransferase [Proteobacteria bacterium]|nr:16S rRNA (uracil(1498)-N(3))-methyltransferase [Pseudomonadota bacterium]MBU2228427.1 16S rRNA (uracil(1498)-N(3))-methyltransferase [Pseudomonadota bacterium]MBU2261867.1 16S rRNA (uracil(1498)-N(3))-methyltransferase [Pseudomonadota bacterium]
MTIPRIYLPRPLKTGDVCAAAADQARYLRAVLRMREGDPLLVFNGSGREYEAVIRQATAEGTTLIITGELNAPEGLIEITLCQAVPKAEKMEAIIRHATELGASRIIPFVAKRSVPRWPAEKSPLKRARWQKIAVEASRQCGRADIPEIGEIVTFEQMLLSARPEGLNLIFWEEESARGVREVLRDPGQTGMTSFLLVIGPEGGFEKDEIDLALQAGFFSVSLGKRVLRVDTAAVAVLAVIQYERGFLGDA